MVRNVAPADVWQALQNDPLAHLVDVRTDREWTEIGIPDLGATGKTLVMVPWHIPPTMHINPAFIEELRAAGLQPEHHLYFLCRSGARSLQAAAAALAAGFRYANNVADGFEGPPDAAGRRGVIAGWQAEGLPWRQIAP